MQVYFPADRNWIYPSNSKNKLHQWWRENYDWVEKWGKSNAKTGKSEAYINIQLRIVSLSSSTSSQLNYQQLLFFHVFTIYITFAPVKKNNCSSHYLHLLPQLHTVFL